MKKTTAVVLSLITAAFLVSCKDAPTQAQEVVLINKWHYDLMQADYDCFSFLVRATMADPAIAELAALIPDDNDNVLYNIAAMMQEHVRNSHTVGAFEELPGKNPWGEVDKPVYRKLLPSEMKAMRMHAGKYSGDCSSISHLTAALCRIAGIPEDDVFVMRTKQHSVVLVKYDSTVYMFNDTFVDELSPVELFFINLYWNTGLYNDRYFAKAGYVLSKDRLSGPGTLKETFEDQYELQFRDLEEERTEQERERLTAVALQRRSTAVADIVTASERGPLVGELCAGFTTMDQCVQWLNENAQTASIFAYDAFMTPDQVIVFKAASRFDKALFLMCYCREKAMGCEVLRGDENDYVVRTADAQYLVTNTITRTAHQGTDNRVPIYTF